MTVAVRTLKPTTNDILLDRIRDDASPAYQSRIPEATKAGVQATLKALQSYRPTQNEFVDALVNKIALTLIQGTSWTNPLAEFKRGLLTGGDTIEEIQVGLIKAKTYDPARDELEKELFGTAPIEVQSSFHKVNRRDRYKVTINERLLLNAFNSPMGLSSFAGQIMSAPGTSDQWDEFLLMCSLFGEYEANGGYFKVNVPDVTNPTSTEVDAKTVLRKIRGVAGNMKFPSTQFNAARMPIAAKAEELILFVTPEFNAAIDVEALAGAFNLSKLELSGRVIEIPAENFGITGAQALMTTKDFFIVADQLFETASQWNPASLQNNYWLHRWQVISASRFVPAVLFTTGAGDEVVKVISPVTAMDTITIIDINGDVPAGSPAQVARGAVYSLAAEAVTTPAEGPNDGVRWSLAGNTSTRTYISQTGVLHVGGDEGAATLLVTATSTWLDADNLMKDGKTANITLAVTGVAVLDAWPAVDNQDTAADDVTNQVTGITVQGVNVSPTFVYNTYTYTADVTDPASVVKADIKVSGPDAGDVTITKNGLVFTITVASAAGDPVYTVTVM